VCPPKNYITALSFPSGTQEFLTSAEQNNFIALPFPASTQTWTRNMNSDDLCFLPATELTRLYGRRQLSPVEVVDAVLRRIARLEPALNAMTRVLEPSARRQAATTQDALANGTAAGLLCGVPVTIKDTSLLKDVPAEFGSHVMRGSVPDKDAVHVARLQAAGAIVIGKTTVSEQGWGGISRNPLTGVTHNPWRRGYNAGASSAGAGVAAAAGYGPLHDASDGMGSIRMPAHFCGVFGLKPTYGRIAQVPLWNTDLMGVSGPITRTVADAALMLRVMAGPHYLDHTCSELGPADYSTRLYEPLGRVRIAYSADLGHARVDAAVADIVAAAVRKFKSELGLAIEPVKISWRGDAPALARLFLASHMCTDEPSLKEFESRMDPALVACIREGASYRAKDYLDARQAKYEYVADMLEFFNDYDYLITPSVSVPAFPVELVQPADWPQHPWDYLMWAQFSYPFNFSGQPAASVPCGFTEDGLPVGMQIAGRRFDDLGVLKLCAAFEKIQPWEHRRPKIATGAAE
jgi:aspartyl-tRNA(Asn)/glutamyl-tRNA(Gln) amidotransferase subunit A